MLALVTMLWWLTIMIIIMIILTITTNIIITIVIIMAELGDIEVIHPHFFIRKVPPTKKFFRTASSTMGGAWGRSRIWFKLYKMFFFPLEHP